MIDFYMYQFSKRKNSTKRPAENAALITSRVCLKHPTDLLAPIVVLAADHGTVEDDDQKIKKCNYAKMYDRYFWITKIVSLNLNHWEIHLMSDPMATFRSQIFNTEAFVVYSAIAGNTQLIDSRLPRYTDGSSTGTLASFPLVWSEEGTYIISVVNNNGVENFKLASYADLRTLMNAFNTYVQEINNKNKKPEEPDEGTYDDTKPSKGIMESIKNAGKSIVDGLKYLGQTILDTATQTLSVGDVGQNIKCCIWFPFNISPGGSAKEIVIGTFKTGVSGLSITKPTVNGDFNIVAPSVNFERAWLRRQGYCMWSLYIPFVGNMVLPNDLMYPGRRINVEYAVNLLSGAAQFVVRAVTSDGAGAVPLETRTAQLACDAMIGSVTPNLYAVGSSLIQAVGSAGRVAGGIVAMSMGNGYGASEVAQGVTATAQNTLNVADAVLSPPSYSVGGWNGVGYVKGEMASCKLSCASFGVSGGDPNNVATTIGTPMFRQARLGSLSGYVMCNGASISCNGSAAEHDAINGYLNSGAFLE